MTELPQPLQPQQLLAHASFVRGIAVSLVGDPDLGADVAQDTLVAALERPPEDADTARGWLAAVARNLARRQRRTTDRSRKRERAASVPEAQRSPEELLEREQILRDVVEAVLALEPPYRSVILHRYYEDLYPREIAERTQTPIATVKSRLHRALGQLRGALDGRYGGRRQWSLPLAGLVGRADPATAAGASSHAAGAVTGTTGKLGALAAAGLIVLGGFGLWMLFEEASSESATTMSRESRDGEAAAGAGSRLPSEEPLANEVGRVSSSSERLGRETATEDTERATRAVTANGRTATVPELQGRVLSRPSGAPVEGASVRWQVGGVSGSVRTDAAGRFILPLEHTGRLELLASHLAFVAEDPATGETVAALTLEVAAEDPLAEVVLELIPTARLSGIVVDAATGEPLPDVLVIARPDDPDRAQKGRSQATGAFDLSGLPPGSYMLLTHHESYHSAHVKDGQVGPFLEIDIAPGEHRDGLRLALERAATLEVRVSDFEGAPVSGARVFIVAAELTLEMLREHEMAGDLGTPRRTSDTGELVMTHLLPATYRLAATHDNLPWTLTDPITIRTGDPHTIMIRLTKGATVFGTVYREGLPLPNAWVESLGSHGKQTRAEADENGRYELPGLRPGDYVLAAGASAERRSEILPTTKRITIDETTEQLEVNFGNEGSRGARLEGRVLRGNDALEGVGIQFLSHDVSHPSAMKGAKTDANGHFVFDGLPPGDALLFVTVDQRRIGGFDSNPVTIPESGTIVRDVLLPTNRISGRIALDGHVLVPHESMMVLVRSAREPPRTLVQHLLDRNAEAMAPLDEEGAFELEGLPADEYVPVLLGQFRPIGASEETAERILQSFPSVRLETTSQVDLGTLRLGDVGEELRLWLSAAHSSKVGQAEVRLFSNGLELSGPLHAYGGSFHTRLMPGTYDVVVLADGLAPGRAENVEVRAGRSTTQQIELSDGGTLIVETTSEGSPARVPVEVLDDRGRALPLSTRMIDRLFVSGGFRTDEEGRFRLDHVAVGPYVVNVGGERHEVEIREGEETVLRVRR